MAPFPPEIWTALALVAAAAVLGMLHTLATYVENQKLTHETHARVARLRSRYLAELTGQAAEPEIGEVDILPDPEPDPLAKVAA